MAAGDILSAVVRADGWSMDVTIEGFAVGATYDFGSLDDTPATVTAPMFSVAVVSEGYSATGVLGTVNRTIYGTHVVRKAYPNQASKDETVSGSDLVVRVALSESVYNDDKNGGAGTSGTNPAVTISATWATNTGGGAQTSAAATALACTNNSTLDYPKVIAQWAWGHTPAWRQVTAATTIGCLAYHGHGIACVALSATDAHAAVVSGIATTKTDHTMSASGLHYESYDLAVPIAGFTAGDDVTLRFIAYPNVGDADSIIDTSTNTTAADDIRGLTQITFTYSPTVTTMYVAQNGNDTTGNGSTGTPYLTIGKALAAGAGIIYVQAGGTNVVDIIGATPASVTQRNYFIDVKPKPGDEATVSLTRTSAGLAWKAKLLRYSGFTMSGGNAYIDGSNVASAKLWFENMTMSVASLGVVGLGYRSVGAFFVNCTETSGVDHFVAFSTDVKGYVFTGCLFSAGAQIKKSGCFVASKMAGTGTDKNALDGNTTGTSTQIESNLIFAHSELVSCVTNASRSMMVGALETVINGVAIIGNVVEVKTVTGSQPALWVAADGTTNSVQNVVVAHNTTTGARTNINYNSVGVAALIRNNWFIRNNAFRGINIKADTFAPANANRVGNWATLNGVNTSDNRYDGGDSFPPDYCGINTAFVAAGGLQLTNDATYGQMGYTNENSADTDGTGNGDYMPTEASVLGKYEPQQMYQSFDLYGTPLG
jgi:hypothetical protein